MGTILFANLKGASPGLGTRLLLCTPMAKEEDIEGLGSVGKLREGPDDTSGDAIRGMLESDTGSERGAGGSAMYVGPG